MKEEYYKIYRQLIESYSSDASYLSRRKVEFIKSVEDAKIFKTETELFKNIEEGIKKASGRITSEEGIEIRPDAIHFLMINFHQMILNPIMLNYFSNNRDKSEYESLMKLIEADIELLIDESLKIARTSETREITGHTIIKVLDQNWSKMKTSKTRIWG